MAVESLSKSAERNILQATHHATALAAAGDSPTDAVVKAATKYNLPQGHSRLVARAYNVARTNQQREEGRTVLEKAADFPLADGDAAEARLFQSKPQAKAASVDVSIDYFLPPTFLADRRAAAGLVERSKQAAEIMALEKRELPPRPAFESQTSYARASQARIQCDMLRAEASAEFDKLASGLSELQQYFQSVKQACYVDTVEHAELMCNQSAIVALALIRPNLSEGVKTAKTTSAMHSQQQQQYALLDQVKTASKTYSERLERLRIRRDDLDELLPKPAAKRLAGDSSVLGLEKVAVGFMSGVLGSTTGATLGNAAHDAATNSPMFNQEKAYAGAVDSIQDPEHESELKNIRTQAMLHSLMLHDPVIRGYDPNEVLTAFNELGEVAPKIADQTLIMQPLLRKRLTQGVLDPFEVSQVVALGNQMPKKSAAVISGGDASVID